LWSKFHGRDLGIPVTVVMPKGAPLVKQVRCAHYGARVLLHGDTIADAKVIKSRAAS
jgi:threonine dehydratase